MVFEERIRRIRETREGMEEVTTRDRYGACGRRMYWSTRRMARGESPKRRNATWKSTGPRSQLPLCSSNRIELVRETAREDSFPDEVRV